MLPLHTVVFDSCKYTMSGREYTIRHGEDVVDVTRCVRCRCNDGELVGCVDTEADDCDAIDDGDEPEGCQFRGQRLAHGDTVKVCRPHSSYSGWGILASFSGLGARLGVYALIFALILHPMKYMVHASMNTA